MDGDDIGIICKSQIMKKTVYKKMIKKTKYRNADSDFSCSNTGITQDIRIGCEL